MTEKATVNALVAKCTALGNNRLCESPALKSMLHKTIRGKAQAWLPQPRQRASFHPDKQHTHTNEPPQLSGFQF